MLRKILFILLVPVVALAAFAVYAYFQPEDFKFERSKVINAPADVVFGQVNDFHKWEAWSPWAKLDPNSTAEFEGQASGTGAIFKWAGNSKVGKGKMTIVESKPNELIRIKLDFIEPMEATSETVFTFKPKNPGTETTWTMTGRNDVIGRMMCMVMNMQKEMNDTFDRGLASMKTAAEAEASGTPAANPTPTATTAGSK